MRNDFFAKVTVSDDAYPGTAQCVFDLRKGTGVGLSLINRGSKVVCYSFDGETDHGDLYPSDPSKGLVFDHRDRPRMWLRLDDGETGSSVVRVEAWVAL